MTAVGSKIPITERETRSAKGKTGGTNPEHGPEEAGSRYPAPPDKQKELLAIEQGMRERESRLRNQEIQIRFRLE